MKVERILNVIRKIALYLLPSLKLKHFYRYYITKSDVKKTSPPLPLPDPQSFKIKSCMWFCPNITNVHAGGAYTIFLIANHLSTINLCKNIFIFETSFPESLQTEIRTLFPQLIFEVIEMPNKHLRNKNNLPHVDIAICTFWMTAFSLAIFNNCKRKFYLLQDDERQFYPSGSESLLVQETYRLGFGGIANSVRIREMYTLISKENCHCYMPGANKNLLTIENYKSKKDKMTIVAYARPSHHRNIFEILCDVLSSMATEYGDYLDIFFVGEDFNPKIYGVSPKIKVLGNLTNDSEIKDLYQKCDIGISFISTPTISYHQLDILSSGRCLVALRNGEIESRFSEDEVYYVSALPKIMKEQLEDLIKDKQKIKTLADSGRNAIARHTWEDSLPDILYFMEQP